MLLESNHGGKVIPRMDPLGIPTLVTERLRLRSLHRSDLDDYAALRADPEVMRYLQGTWDRGRSWRHLLFLQGHWWGHGTGMWAVTERETGAFLGLIGFAEPEGWPGFELAWALARRWWGNGYATEGARAALAYAFTILRKDRVISLIQAENCASIRVAERLGERLLGPIDHYGREMLCYGIERESYAAQLQVSQNASQPQEKESPAGTPALPGRPCYGSVELYSAP